jgi:hypothetical protein
LQAIFLRNDPKRERAVATPLAPPEPRGDKAQ